MVHRDTLGEALMGLSRPSWSPRRPSCVAGDRHGGPGVRAVSPRYRGQPRRRRLPRRLAAAAELRRSLFGGRKGRRARPMVPADGRRPAGPPRSGIPTGRRRPYRPRPL